MNRRVGNGDKSSQGAMAAIQVRDGEDLISASTVGEPGTSLRDIRR